MLKKQVETFLPTRYGNYNMVAYSESEDELRPHFVLQHKMMDPKNVVSVRIHSECLTGDLLGSYRCDCGEQLDTAMDLIEKDRGLLIYLRQEGRGIGLINKLKAYNVQDKGRNTIEANVELGFKPDLRKYDLGLQILTDLGIKRINLITNNPRKLEAIENSSIELVERIPLIIPSKSENEEYLQVKKELMGHLLG